ncbi:troponin I 2 isoform X2 [Rhopalosiphum padi]|uniref:troponin I 2 isoform X2 n=1 Tax=Rhopalosiphum padi TaxID=40932 RepID=UPI00298DDE97|nr:troponin I 2 isoform X2 [Rhopalosiphum padi]
MADDEAKKAKQAEIDRKRAEVRKRMEEASKAKKAKKGFMTPDRKKKLRLLLRKKAAEELKKEQERKAAERRRIIEERCGQPKNIDDAGEEELAEICEELWKRLYTVEGIKFDLERDIRMKVFEISELNSQVNDLRGKFVKPTLKKVSKYENKFAKLQKKAAEFNFRNQLKVVKKKEFTLEEEDKEKKPDWSKKGDEKKGEGEDGDGTEDEKTDDGLTTEGESNAGDMTDATEDAQSDNEIIEPEPVVEPEPEPQPPSPAPEELWAYLKDTVCSNNPLSVDDLVDKLMTAVTAIPQPLLNSVVKDTIKKQKSIDEGLEGGPPAEGDPAAPADPADPSAAPADPSADPSATPADPTTETAVPTDPATEAAPTDPATAATEPADPTTAAAAEAQPAPPAEGEQPAATEEVKPAEAPAAEATPEAAPAAAESVPEPAATA